MKQREAHRLVLGSMFKDLSPYHQNNEHAEEQTQPLSVGEKEKQLAALLD